MCHLVYTNFQKQSAVINMTVAEVRAEKVQQGVPCGVGVGA